MTSGKPGRSCARMQAVKAAPVSAPVVPLAAAAGVEVPAVRFAVTVSAPVARLPAASPPVAPPATLPVITPNSTAITATVATALSTIAGPETVRDVRLIVGRIIVTLLGE
ncbi:hypothetical protein GCM10023074_61190 [Microbispora amethystogenes]|uniref:Uncharacterized protein n=1 Tax=Microbispora amethystogenes TaxID=1427754 RepID=A0ABQ4FJL1_9ACTN|nr:hypothetical protein Mam01_51750 [Microbispora amethystogenes]